MIMEYATDTYQVFNFSKDEIYTQYAMSGRFVTAIIGRLIKIAGISEIAIYIISSISAIIFALLSIYKLYKIIKVDVDSRFLKFLIPFLIIINPFSIELFLFIEKGIMWFGVFMCICAVEQVVKYLSSDSVKRKKKKNVILALFLMFVANCSYQGVVGIFVSISLVYILKYSKNVKEFLKNNVVIGCIYGIPALLDFILIKLLYNSNRLNGRIAFNESIIKIIINTKKMAIKTYNILPKYLLIFCIFFTFVLLCCKIIMGKNTQKWYIIILKYLYILIGIVVITVIPQIAQPTKDIWFVARSTYSFSSIYGILVLYLFLNCKMDKSTTVLIIAISLILLMFQFQKFGIIIKDRYILNEKDYNVSMQIINKIKEYEQNTGKKITKIQIYDDKNPGYTYGGIFATGDINVKAYSTEWSTKAILEYYLKRKLIQEEKNEEIMKFFLERDWNEFNEEQIIFSENTINLCKF